MDVAKGNPIVGLGLVQAVLALILAFGSSLSADQVGAILAVAAIVLSFVGRMLVVPVAKFKAREAEELAKLQKPPEPPMYPHEPPE